MIKNLTVASDYKRIKKQSVHKLVKSLRDELDFEVYSLELNFLRSEKIHFLNRQYLKHDYPTDIITFNYSESTSILDGEIFISYQDAIKNAKKYRVSVNEELIRLIVHGILHLIGYNDITVYEKKIMKTLENQLTYKNNFALL